MNAQCSQTFRDAFKTNCCGCLRDCACGRTHFDGSTESRWDWEDGELEKLRALQVKAPDSYIERDGAIETMEISGCEVVVGCSCQTAEEKELFIKQNLRAIVNYIRLTKEKLQSQAKELDIN